MSRPGFASSSVARASSGGWLLPLLPPLLAPIAVLLGLRGGRFVLPVLTTMAVYPCFARLVVDARRTAAVAAALLWAASLSGTLIALTAHDPAGVGAVVLNGPAYRDELFAFIATGAGRESEPARFLPQHAAHLGLFVAATLATGGLLGLATGAVLIGYMSYYVGALVHGPAPALALLYGWSPWAVTRVVAYILLGVVLSRPVLALATGRRIPADGVLSMTFAAVVLLLLDVTLKTLLAPHWPALLRPCLP
jgi:hypothetical protein